MYKKTSRFLQEAKTQSARRLEPHFPVRLDGVGRERKRREWFAYLDECAAQGIYAYGVPDDIRMAWLKVTPSGSRAPY
jgi:hypothetical protein